MSHKQPNHDIGARKRASQDRARRAAHTHTEQQKKRERRERRERQFGPGPDAPGWLNAHESTPKSWEFFLEHNTRA